MQVIMIILKEFLVQSSRFVLLVKTAYITVLSPFAVNEYPAHQSSHSDHSLILFVPNFQHTRPQPVFITFVCLLPSSQSLSGSSKILLFQFLQCAWSLLAFLLFIYHEVSITKQSWLYPLFLS